MVTSAPAYFLQTVIWPPVRLFLAVFGSFRVQGAEHIPAKGPVIFAANHASELDPILVPAALPFLSNLFPMFYVAKKREFYRETGLRSFLYGGALFKLWGAYPVRENLKNYRLSLNIHLEMLREGKSLLIFPEGRVTPDGSIGEAHGGAAYLAWATGAPVIPVAISGTYGISLGKLVVGGRRISVSFGEPFYFKKGDAAEEPTVEELRAFAETTLDAVRKLMSAPSS